MRVSRPPTWPNGRRAGISWAGGLELFPDSARLPEALCELGWTQQNLGKLDEAVALYEKVLAKSDREIAAGPSS